MNLFSVLLNGGGWELGTFLTNLAGNLKYWGGLLFIVFGVVMIIAGIYQLVKGLVGHGKTQTNWVIVIALIFVGGVLAVSGSFSFVENIAAGGRATIESMGSAAPATVQPYIFPFF